MSGGRASRSLSVAVVTSVALVFALAYVDLRREQARALDDFTGEQAALARTLAATMSARVSAVLRDLDTIATLDRVATPALDQLVAQSGFYQELDLLDADGRVRQAVHGDHPAVAGDRRLQNALARLFASAPRDGRSVVSAPLPRAADRRQRLRFFLRRDARGAVALLADTDRFFDGIRQAAFESSVAPMRWMVMDDAGRWVVLGVDDHEDGWREGHGTAEVAHLLSAMARGEHGTLFLPRDSAEALGLERRSAVAGFAAVPLRTGSWSVAVVASAKRVRDRARLAAWRLAAATGMTALIVGLFGVAITRQQRRAQALADALGLAEATASLRERSEKLVESVPLGVLAVDAAERVTAVNPFLAERGARAGASLTEALPGLSAEERAPIDALLAEARATRRSQTRQGLALTLDRKTREVDALAIPLARPLPDVDCFLVLHDRTDIRRLERSLVRAEKLATIGTLSAGIAHEVGTPLGIISGRAEQLLTRVPDGEAGEAMRKGLSSILGQVDKVSSTIRELLDFARVRPATVEAVSAAAAVGAAASLLEHRFRQAKVALATDAPPSLPPLAADRGQLEQVLVNLLMNACDACGAGGHVRARALAADEGVLLEVSDDGSGIAAEHLPSVLDPFFTTKKRGQGTGLGLTIAADIVKNHGGCLAIDSAPGKGTTVRVVWPSAPPAERA
ncbi:MAG: histidine kinase [bacterium]|nr:histidine kinase [bacterium]